MRGVGVTGGSIDLPVADVVLCESLVCLVVLTQHGEEAVTLFGRLAVHQLDHDGVVQRLLLECACAGGHCVALVGSLSWFWFG